MRLFATDAKQGRSPCEAASLRVQAPARVRLVPPMSAREARPQPVVQTAGVAYEHVNVSHLRGVGPVGSYTCRRMALTSPECMPTRMDNLVILHDDQPVGS